MREKPGGVQRFRRTSDAIGRGGAATRNHKRTWVRPPVGQQDYAPVKVVKGGVPELGGVFTVAAHEKKLDKKRTRAIAV